MKVGEGKIQKGSEGDFGMNWKRRSWKEYSSRQGGGVGRQKVTADWEMADPGPAVPQPADETPGRRA